MHRPSLRGQSLIHRVKELSLTSGENWSCGRGLPPASRKMHLPSTVPNAMLLPSGDHSTPVAGAPMSLAHSLFPAHIQIAISQGHIIVLQKASTMHASSWPHACHQKMPFAFPAICVFCDRYMYSYPFGRSKSLHSAGVRIESRIIRTIFIWM